LLLSLLATPFAWPTNLLAADEATRTFPAQKCRYTLPGPDWTWSDEKAPNRIFLARDTKGFVITLATLTQAAPVQVNEQFVQGFEKSFYKAASLKKRSGRFVTFLGVRGYQTESLLPDGRTSATRVFAAHGLMYNLVLIGAKEPIENDPSFEKIMHGFSFTVPPAPDARPTDSGADTDVDKGAMISELMGSIATVCSILAVLLVVFRWATGKGKKRKQSD
jgi:hypothetical protein